MRAACFGAPIRLVAASRLAEQLLAQRVVAQDFAPLPFCQQSRARVMGVVARSAAKPTSLRGRIGPFRRQGRPSCSHIPRSATPCIRARPNILSLLILGGLF